MTYSIDLKDSFVSVIATGAYSLDHTVRMIRESMEVAATNDRSRMFIDIADVRGNVPLTDRYDFALALVNVEHEQRTKGRPAVKVALFGNEPIIDPGRFGEMVASNRGVNILVTDDRQRAYIWLGISPFDTHTETLEV